MLHHPRGSDEEVVQHLRVNNDFNVVVHHSLQNVEEDYHILSVARSNNLVVLETEQHLCFLYERAGVGILQLLVYLNLTDVVLNSDITSLFLNFNVCLFAPLLK
jgi:hypothetical protein